MVLAWDEEKRQANIANHGFDFEGVEAIFDGPVFSWDDDREAYGEQRINLLGVLNGRVMHLTYTDDGDILRVISLREATHHEIRTFEKEALAR